MAHLSSSVFDRVQAFLLEISTNSAYRGFEKRLFEHVHLHEEPLDTTVLTYSFVIQDFMCNKDDVLHDGAATTVLDNLSSTALFTIQRPAFWQNFGVSRSINVTFHRAVPRGTPVKIKCRVIAAGERMGYGAGSRRECPRRRLH